MRPQQGQGARPRASDPCRTLVLLGADALEALGVEVKLGVIARARAVAEHNEGDDGVVAAVLGRQPNVVAGDVADAAAGFRMIFVVSECFGMLQCSLYVLKVHCENESL